MAAGRKGGSAALKLSLTVNGEDRTIELLDPAPLCRFQLDGAAPRQAEVEQPVPGVYSVLLDGRSWDAFVEEDARGLIVTIDGHHFEVEVHDPRRYTRNAAGRAGHGIQTLTSPMPGKVVRLLAKPGDSVEAGQGVLVVEAMKMQNELKAARAGKVVTVSAKEGATVVAGEPLATIE
jgi:biotin carboxyl carrier protein